MKKFIAEGESLPPHFDARIKVAGTAVRAACD
jgi:hypothetical protein